MVFGLGMSLRGNIEQESHISLWESYVAIQTEQVPLEAYE